MQLGKRIPMSTQSIVISTLYSLFIPLYLMACPYNVFNMAADLHLPKNYGVGLILWVLIQVRIDMIIMIIMIRWDLC